MSGKKFRFSLASVLAVRQHEAESAQMVLAKARHRRAAHEEHLQHLQARLGAQHRRVTGAGPTTAHALHRHSARCQEARLRYEQANATLVQLHADEQEARVAMQQAYRAEEGLQVLRDKEQAEHQSAVRAAETAFLDEQAVLRYGRKSQQVSL